ncbi:hypothetical protein [Plantactinospora sp. B24E8]|uniref:hypothetical protein n=1 Tax=Plantactinospora sp. B24E8 TaxID=3153567 RepID=UPI00325F1E03
MAGVSRELVDRLYTAPPDGFVAARAEAVAAARAAGDVAAAREIGRLRKPTVAAWLVNLLAARRPELMAELVELSAGLRAAQRELRGPRLRELSAQRRRIVSTLVGQARALAVVADSRLAAGKLPLAEVETTLNAALADPEVAEQVRSGRLVRAASYAGFGEVPRPQLRLIVGGPDEVEPAGARPEEPGAGTEKAGPPADDTGAARAAAQPSRAAAQAARAATGHADAEAAAAGAEAARAAEQADAARVEAAAARAEAARSRRRGALDRALTQARTRQERAEAELARTVEAERAGAAALTELETALAELQKRRVAAERALGEARAARKAAERGAIAARRQVGEVQAAVEALAAEDTPSGKSGRTPGKSVREAHSSG